MVAARHWNGRLSVPFLWKGCFRTTWPWVPFGRNIQLDLNVPDHPKFGGLRSRSVFPKILNASQVDPWMNRLELCWSKVLTPHFLRLGTNVCLHSKDELNEFQNLEILCSNILCFHDLSPTQAFWFCWFWDSAESQGTMWPSSIGPLLGNPPTSSTYSNYLLISFQDLNPLICWLLSSCMSLYFRYAWSCSQWQVGCRRRLMHRPDEHLDVSAVCFHSLKLSWA